MTIAGSIRILSGSGAAWRAQRWERGNTTEGGQDKRAHIAHRSVGCFCWIFLSLPHLATFISNVCHRHKSLHPKEISHIVGPRHVR